MVERLCSFELNVNHTFARVWVKILGLSQECETKNYIFAIVSSLYTPICIDSSSSKPFFNRPFGHFVRVLLDIDLLKDLRYKILVERVGFAFYMDIKYEKLLELSNYCKVIGHSLGICKKRNANLEEANKSKTRNDT